MDEQQWTGQLDLTVFFDGNRSVSRDIFFEKALKVIRPVYLNQSTIPTFYYSKCRWWLFRWRSLPYECECRR